MIEQTKMEFTAISNFEVICDLIIIFDFDICDINFKKFE